MSEALVADLGEDVWISSTTVRKLGWRRVYTAGLMASDLSAGLLAAAAVTVLAPAGGLASRSVTAAVVTGVWFLACVAGRAHELRSMPAMADDLRRLARVAVVVSALAGFALLAADQAAHREALVIGLPVALAASALSRVAGTTMLRVARSRGRCFNRVVVVGGEEEVLDLIGRMRRDDRMGLDPVAACLPGSGNRVSLVRHQVPVMGDVWDAVRVARDLRATGIVIGGGSGVDSTVVRRLSWQLEGELADVVVAPPVTEVSNRRVNVRSLADAPLLHISGRGRGVVASAAKGLLERSIALLALVVLAPVMVSIAAVIRVTSPGPALFRQTRVGRDGREFTLLKFRTMVRNAHELRDELAHLNICETGPMFKIQRDPRVTRIGAWLRRTSLDELPQLINVVAGKMALVGPRPPLPCEVERYTEDVWRRLLVKPGLTGLWQVSGRSDLSWEEAVRLDLRYVENWSLGLDLAILCRTWSAVVRGRGAY